MFATPAFLPVIPPLPSGSGSGSGKDLDGCGFNSKLSTSSRLKVKTNAQAAPKINGSSVGLSSGKECVKTDEEISSPPPRTIINQLPDWSMLLAAITTIFLAAEKQWMMLDWKPKRSDVLIDPFGLGRFVQDGFVFRQNFPIRSYEIGADRTASIETLMNHLQEAALSHCKSAGLLGDGFGSTPEMCRRNLIWVVTRMQVIVDSYPTWGDIVQVDTWATRMGKNGMRRDWVVHDCRTGESLARASSVWVMMNTRTRKLSKIPDEVRAELDPSFRDATTPVIDEDGRKLPKLNGNSAEYIMSGLTPRWTDLDVNLHVNNVKYIGWILESTPMKIVENFKLSGMTLEYRRECGRDSVLQSLTTVAGGDIGGLKDSGHIECEHLLRLQNGAEVLRARTKWQPKHTKNEDLGQIQAEGA